MQFMIWIHSILFLMTFYFPTLMYSQAQSGKMAAPFQQASEVKLLSACKIWGATKYLHPRTLYQTQLWDSALVSVLPTIQDAKNSDEYAIALNHLFSFLHDPYSFIASKQSSAVITPSKESRITHSVRDSIMYIHLPLAYCTLFTAQRTAEKLSTLFIQASETTKGIILDVRGDSTMQLSVETVREHASRNHYILETALAYYLANDVVLPDSRSRVYNWYCPQSVYDFTDMMKQRYENCPKEIIYHEGKWIRKKTTFTTVAPMVILVNRYTFGVDDIITALQEQCAAIVVNHGIDLMPSSGNLLTISLPESNIIGCLRTSEYSYYHRTDAGIQPNHIVPLFSSPTNADTCVRYAYSLLLKKKSSSFSITSDEKPSSTMDEPYKTMLYPSKEYRLLALFRFWNVIQYFFPYKHLMDAPWDSIFVEFIPKIERAKDSLEYAFAIAELANRLHDSHAQMKFQVFANHHRIASNMYGNDYLPLHLQYIENKTVVTDILGDKPKQIGMNVGDVITHIDGQPIEHYQEKFLPYFSYSTRQAALERIHSFYLVVGKKTDSVSLTIRKANNTIKTVTLSYSLPSVPPTFPHKRPPVQMLNSTMGYIDLRQISIAQCDSAFEAIKESKGVIFDMRGYPKGTAWEIASRLTNKRRVGAQFIQPMMNPVRYSSLHDDEQQSSYTFEQYIEPNTTKWHYIGKIVVLINAEAMSQAEHTCLLLEAVANATFVGSPTNGTDGTVTSMVLPGGIEVGFTGQAVRHADGRQLQRIGIQPHVLATPTIAGIRAGRDEVLEKGIEVLREMIATKK